MTKTELAKTLDDIKFMGQRGLGYRQLTRRTVNELRELLANSMMTREQRQASYARHYHALGRDY